MMKWEILLHLFDDHLLAHNFDGFAEKRKLAILCSNLGAERFRICADLCHENDISYAETICILEQRFALARSRILARAQFNWRKQQPGKDYAQYARTLRALASKC